MPIDDEDDAFSLFDKLEARVPHLLEQALERVARGDPGEPQDESLATYAGLSEPEWREIDWSQPARAIHNQVRSWAGLRDTPRGAFGMVEGVRILITRSRIHSEAPPAQLGPGSVVERSDDFFVIQCGDGLIEILEWEPEPAVVDE